MLTPLKETIKSGIRFNFGDIMFECLYNTRSQVSAKVEHVVGHQTVDTMVFTVSGEPILIELVKYFNIVLAHREV